MMIAMSNLGTKAKIIPTMMPNILMMWTMVAAKKMPKTMAKKMPKMMTRGMPIGRRAMGTGMIAMENIEPVKGLGKKPRERIIDEG